ncbi:MAG: hypothetical protein AB7U75_04845 [Hyphomicrobiaceae bacterium]
MPRAGSPPVAVKGRRGWLGENLIGLAWFATLVFIEASPALKAKTSPSVMIEKSASYFSA